MPVFVYWGCRVADDLFLGIQSQTWLATSKRVVCVIMLLQKQDASQGPTQPCIQSAAQHGYVPPRTVQNSTNGKRGAQITDHKARERKSPTYQLTTGVHEGAA